MRKFTATAGLLGLFLFNNTKGFVPHKSGLERFRNSRQLFVLQGDPELPLVERIRPSRRDVYNYDKWVEARSTDRFFGVLLNLLDSGVFGNIFKDLVFLSCLAVWVCLYNGFLVEGFYDLDHVYHPALVGGFPELKLPAQFFALLTPSLALLLVFKTSTSYKRWDEARKNWGAIVNSSRTIMREGAAWIHEAKLPDDKKQRLMERLELAVWSFPRSLTRHFLSAREDEADYAKDVRERLRPDLAEDLIAARHKPTRALYELSCAINEFPVEERRKISMDHSVTVLCDAMGSSERIFTSPVPRFYTRHTARFTELWLALVPLGLYDAFKGSWNHWTLVPATFVLGFFILGIEELSIQLEEPLSLLPQHAITANSIGKVCTESVDWRKTDYERMLDVYQNGSGFQ